MQSLGAIAHISYKEPALCSYEMAAQYMRELKLSMKEIGLTAEVHVYERTVYKTRLRGLKI